MPTAKKPSRKRIAVNMTQDRETKGTRRYLEDGDRDAHRIGTLYLKKAAAAELDNPTRVTVLVTEYVAPATKATAVADAEEVES